VLGWLGSSACVESEPGQVDARVGDGQVHVPADGSLDAGVPEASVLDARVGDGQTGSDADASPDARVPQPSLDSGAVVPDEDGGPQPSSICNAGTWMALAPDLRGCDLSDANLRAADLSGADLRGADLNDADLTIANLNGADLRGADLRDARLHHTSLVGADLAGADLSGAWLYYGDLRGARTFDLHECPTEPGLDQIEHQRNWTCVLQPANGRYLLQTDGVDLRGADLTGVELSEISRAVQAYDLIACPATVPSADWTCQLQPGNGRYALLGPEVSLVGADLGGMHLAGEQLTGARAYDVICPATLPGAAWACIPQPATGRSVLVAPGVSLVGGDLTGADLSGVDLSSADVTGARMRNLTACPSALPNADTSCIAQSATLGFVLLGPNLDLSGIDLSGMDLTGVNLIGADLAGVDFTGADLTGARLFNLVACPAQLPSSSWKCALQGYGGYAIGGPGVSLFEANVSYADLSGADLSGADMQGVHAFLANFRDANLSGADMSASPRFADLTLSNFSGATLNGATLRDADLHECDFTGAGLSNADLAHSSLRSSNLSGADLTGADLTNAVAFDLVACPAALPNTDWTCVAQPAVGRHFLLGPYADLRGANLSSAVLTVPWPTGVYTDATTLCPNASLGPCF